MKRAPSTTQVFALLVLALAGVASAAGLLQSIDTTLRSTASTDHAPAPQGNGWEHPAASTMIGADALHGTAHRPDNLLFDRDHLLAARQALEALPGLAGYRLTVFRSIDFHADGRITLDLVDPLQAGRVDSYHYAGGQWRKGAPVNPQQFAPTISLRRSSTALANIDFDAVPRVAQALQQQRTAWMRTPSDVDHVQVVVHKGGRLQWLPDEVTGDRGSARLSFDGNGNLQ